MKVEFRPTVPSSKGEQVLDQPVVELATAREVGLARDLIISNVNPDYDAQPVAYLDAVVMSEENLGINHSYPIKLIGQEALTLMVARAKDSAQIRDQQAGRLALAAA